ncbi:uncharacterized protein MONOS_4778 [Monocercomonoides exilis]|uniref:uncharacterized protein n=1 Tax=Monocercomonoides exilis TaxID=2049356 RepID=UPI003559EA0C|nr:hypothetical protein MONOS_4778 [Monocercomonoides exilis]|eukprot:MONOS_4778.1-p1 / transcript=MONOS_4778.1 / gene=MONOS_4778 / organism=Monocercomonoides_exilis_PA203 / gene_product=unspecified product / transcript_product=unspecified product / location=Mono_scaffold00132:759-1430(-) / protein_length=209 / sequence_SO=supercontig / SO=protein_coding / is_pseudo=false
MENFHKDILRFGSLVGLRHFQFYLRGREELVVSVNIPSPTSKEEICEPYLVTLYYKKGAPIVYSLRDASLETGKTSEEQTEITLSTVTNWKKRQVRLRAVLEDLISYVARKNGIPSTTIENPFSVDRNYFSAITDKPETIQTLFPLSSHIIACPEQVSLLASMTSGALVSLLGEIFVASPTYAPSLFEDLKYLTEYHFNHSLLIGMKE